MNSANNLSPTCTRSPTKALPPNVSIPSPGYNASGDSTGRNALGGAGGNKISKSTIFFQSFSTRKALAGGFILSVMFSTRDSLECLFEAVFVLLPLTQYFEN